MDVGSFGNTMVVGILDTDTKMESLVQRVKRDLSAINSSPDFVLKAKAIDR